MRVVGTFTVICYPLFVICRSSFLIPLPVKTGRLGEESSASILFIVFLHCHTSMPRGRRARKKIHATYTCTKALPWRVVWQLQELRKNYLGLGKRVWFLFVVLILLSSFFFLNCCIFLFSCWGRFYRLLYHGCVQKSHSYVCFFFLNPTAPDASSFFAFLFFPFKY